MIAIVDYGVGNLFSLRSSFACIGEEAVVTNEKKVLQNADKIILPGVGAFGDAVQKLRESGLYPAVLDECKKGKPMMGICLGMQLLFEESYEFGRHEGLGLIEGKVKPLAGVIDPDLKIPHIGWNPLRFVGESKFLSRIKEGDCVYFVHSFYATECESSVVANAEYGTLIPAIVEKDNVCGCQFHPEKSGKVGLDILRAFCASEG